MTIDYSEWVIIGTGSEREGSAPPPRSAPEAKASTTAAKPSTTTPTAASGELINPVTISCDLDKQTKLHWYSMPLESDHPIFDNSVLPVAELIGIPLVMHKVGTQSRNRADLDNQIATYMNIDPATGFAPPE